MKYNVVIAMTLTHSFHSKLCFDMSLLVKTVELLQTFLAITKCT
jgi:hypothetical protein